MGKPGNKCTGNRLHSIPAMRTHISAPQNEDAEQQPAPLCSHSFVNIAYSEFLRKHFFWGKVYEVKISGDLVIPKYLGIHIL